MGAPASALAGKRFRARAARQGLDGKCCKASASLLALSALWRLAKAGAGSGGGTWRTWPPGTWPVVAGEGELAVLGKKKPQ